MNKRFIEGFLLKGFLKNSFTGCLKKRAAAKKGSTKIDAVKRHLNKYLDDLRLHFDLSDEDILRLLVQTYCANMPSNPFIKCLGMIKYWN